MSRDSKSKLESWSETVVNFVTYYRDNRTNCCEQDDPKHNISTAYVSHIHTQSVTYILVFKAMDPD